MEHPKNLGTAGLTRRERDLVAEILAGHSNKAIAAKFGVKEQTIRNQLSVLFRKLEVSSRLELAVKFRARDSSES
jgi:two-component system nitrate/nitrite response regulator NarL